jgi:hypothetical protein
MLIRPITTTDKELLATCWPELLPASQRLRLLDDKPRLTGADLRYLTQVDADQMLLLAFTDDQRTLLGLARYTRLPDDPRTAEMALVVTPTELWDHAGRLLAETLAEVAYAKGIERFRAVARTVGHAPDATPAARHQQRRPLARRRAGRPAPSRAVR